jgi:hypothetical protein
VAVSCGTPASVAARDRVESYLLQLIGTQLGRPWQAIPVDQSFFDLGMSSLGMAALIKAVGGMVGADISPGVVFEHTDIRRFATYLRSVHPTMWAPRGDRVKATLPASTQTNDRQVLERILWTPDEDVERYEKVVF